MEKVYVLRNCLEDMTSHGGFIWPKEGHVECDDWLPTEECGNGLHGFLWGVGDTHLLYPQENCYWLIVEVDKDKIIDLGNKVKFPEGNVVFCTQDRDKVIEKMITLGANPNTIMYNKITVGDNCAAIVGNKGSATAGNNGTATAGYNGTATTGNYGTATAGYNGTATAGYNGTATAGNNGTATAGDRGSATAGYNGTATAGYNGTATAGDRGSATADNDGTSTAGDNGTATAGIGGTATAGIGGTATAGIAGKCKVGEGGIISIYYFDGERKKLKVGYCPEDIKPNTFYRVINGKFV